MQAVLCYASGEVVGQLIGFLQGKGVFGPNHRLLPGNGTWRSALLIRQFDISQCRCGCRFRGRVVHFGGAGSVRAKSAMTRLIVWLRWRRWPAGMSDPMLRSPLGRETPLHIQGRYPARSPHVPILRQRFVIASQAGHHPHVAADARQGAVDLDADGV